MADQTSFKYDAIAGRVVFGVGSRQSVASEVSAIGVERIMVIASDFEAALADEIEGILGDLSVGRFTDVVQHVPVERAAAAREMAQSLGADAVLSVGGGSATGFAKAVSLTNDVKVISLPTTYAGSEMTTIWGLTDGDHKQTGKDPRVKPHLVIYDPELTLSLPAQIAGPSGMNALAHSVEALYGPGANPVVSLMALESVRVLCTALPDVTADPANIEARTQAMYGAYLAGTALASGGTALHHKTCHVLGGMFNLNHGDMNSVVLGHAVAYNAPAMPQIMDQLSRAMATKDVPGALFDLAASLGAPTSLAAIGMPQSGIQESAGRVVTSAAANVRPPTEAGMVEMLTAAFHGDRPNTAK